MAAIKFDLKNILTKNCLPGGDDPVGRGRTVPFTAFYCRDDKSLWISDAAGNLISLSDLLSGNGAPRAFPTTVAGRDGVDGQSIVGPRGPKGDSIVGPPGRDGKDAVGRPGEQGRPGVDGRPGADAPQRTELDAVKKEMVELKSFLLATMRSELADRVREHEEHLRRITKLAQLLTTRAACLKDGKDGKDSTVPGPPGPRGDVLVIGDGELQDEIKKLRQARARTLAIILDAIEQNESGPPSHVKQHLRIQLKKLEEAAR